MTGTRRSGVLLALATAGISGVAVFLNSSGVRAFGDPTTYTTAKNLVAALVLLAIAATGTATGARVTRPTSARQWTGLAAVGLIGGAVPFVLFFEGLARASTVQAAVLHKTLVLWVALLAFVVLRERLRPAHGAAIGLLLVGQAGLGGGLVTRWGVGEWLVLAATALWSVEVVIAKRLLAGLSPWTVGLARMVLGSALLIGWLAVRGDAAALVRMTGEQWAWVLLTGVLLAAYVGTWLAALSRADAVDVTSVLVLGAIVTAGLDAAVHGRPLLPQAAWLTLVLAGGAIAAVRAWREPAARAAVPVRGAVAATGP